MNALTRFQSSLRALSSLSRPTTTTSAVLTHATRSFSSTSSASGSADRQLAWEHANVPAYPHGPAQWFKKANFGLYGNAKIRFGNKVSERNEVKTRRVWRPNAHFHRLWSVSLRRRIRVKVSTRVLRTIDKSGGLDEYLLGNTKGRIRELGMEGWKLRWRVMQTPSIRKKLNNERNELKIPSLIKELRLLTKSGKEAETLEEQLEAYDELLDKEPTFEFGDEAAAASEKVVAEKN